MEFSPARRVCNEQLKALVDFMGQHVEFAKGELRGNVARHESKTLWAELTKTINGIGGTKKTPDMWSRYWSDFKNKLKRKLKLLERAKRLGNGSEIDKPLSKLEKRALVILGSKFTKFRNRRREDWDNSFQNLLTVKVEEYQDNGELCKVPSKISDRLSDGKKDDASEESSAEDDEDIGEENGEMSLHNIYPEWLIEVEKKRAEAELTRAKAEEQRAGLAAKTADAAVTQAEALKKLSEAAAVQAEALMRIAVLLENRNHQDLLPI